MTEGGSQGEVSAREAFLAYLAQYPQELVLFQVSDLAIEITGAMRSLLAPHGITPAELRVLAVCAAMGECTATDVANNSSFELSAVSRSVQKLVERGLLVREAQSRDRRLTVLVATEQAYALALELCPAVEALQGRIVEALSAGELDTLRSWLGAMTRAADELLPSEVSPFTF